MVSGFSRPWLTKVAGNVARVAIQREGLWLLPQNHFSSVVCCYSVACTIR